MSIKAIGNSLDPNIHTIYSYLLKLPSTSDDVKLFGNQIDIP